MKLSKLFHVISVIAGLAGVILFVATGILSFGNTNALVFGVTKIDALLCIVVLLLIAVWLQVATIHHMMLEKKGEIV